MFTMFCRLALFGFVWLFVSVGQGDFVGSGAEASSFVLLLDRSGFGTCGGRVGFSAGSSWMLVSAAIISCVNSQYQSVHHRWILMPVFMDFP